MSEDRAAPRTQPAQSAQPPQPAQPTEKPSLERLKVLTRILSLMRPHRVRFAIGAFSLLVGSALGLIYPQAARYAVDAGMRDGSSAELDNIAALFVGLLLFQGALVWLRHYLMSWIGQRAVADLRTRVYEHLLGLSSSWFHERRTGEIVGRLAADVTVVENVVGSDLSFALRSVVQLVGGVILLFTVDVKLTLTTLGVVPPVALGAVIFGRVIRRMSQRVQDHLAEASAQVQESVGAIQTVQAFVREPMEVDRYGAGVERAFEQGLSLARWRSSFFAAVTMGGYCAIVIILWVGGRRVISGDLTAGQLVAFLLYTGTVAGGLVSVANLWGSLQRAAGATLRLFDILDTTSLIQDPPSPTPLPNTGGRLVFDDVHFAYPAATDRTVLHGVSVRVDPGEVVALVGPSGSGKSTLTALALRFFDVQKGSVTFEDVDVRELSLSELRGHIAIVSQEPVLFSGSVRENIAFGRPDADHAAVEAAALDANADSFIRQLPEGYDTLVGERGVKLSGGQRQRIAIARALLCDPRLLILDEATSSLDSESEALVQAALSRLMEGRTTLVIAHRLSTVVDADRICVLEHGHLVEQGSHAQLMAGSGTYRRLVEHQLRANETEGLAVATT